MAHDDRIDDLIKNLSFIKRINFVAVVLLLFAPIILGIYLFLWEPQVQYPLYKETYQAGANTTIFVSENPSQDQPGPFALLRDVFNSPPGFNWYRLCFEDMSIFNPPKESNQLFALHVDMSGNQSFIIRQPENPVCTSIHIGENFSAKIYFAGNLTVHKGQTAFIQSPNIFTELELWSAFAKLIIFVLAWDAAGVLICEVFKKIYDSDHHKK